MANSKETFFTSVGCMDGRVQRPVAEFGVKLFEAQYPDTITEAGLVGKLASRPDSDLLDSVKTKIEISHSKHHSKGIIVHGHQECAGNPVNDSVHKKDVLDAAKVIERMAPGLRVVPVFVERTNSGWQAIEIQ